MEIKINGYDIEADLEDIKEIINERVNNWKPSLSVATVTTSTTSSTPKKKYKLRGKYKIKKSGWTLEARKKQARRLRKWHRNNGK